MVAIQELGTRPHSEEEKNLPEARFILSAGHTENLRKELAEREYSFLERLPRNSFGISINAGEEHEYLNASVEDFTIAMQGISSEERAVIRNYLGMQMRHLMMVVTSYQEMVDDYHSGFDRTEMNRNDIQNSYRDLGEYASTILAVDNSHLFSDEEYKLMLGDQTKEAVHTHMKELSEINLLVQNENLMPPTPNMVSVAG